MASSYDPVRGSDLDKVRELLGDTAVQLYSTEILDEDALHSDEHITALLLREGYAMGLSWLAAELVARFEQDPVRVSSQGDSLDFSNLLKQWRELAAPALARATQQAAAGIAVPARVASMGRITAGLINPLR